MALRPPGQKRVSPVLSTSRKTLPECLEHAWAKKRKQSSAVLFDEAGDISSGLAMAAEYAEANPTNAAQMVSFKGGGGELGAPHGMLAPLRARPTRNSCPAL